MMKYLLLLFFPLICCQTFSQRTSINIYLGTSNYEGDLQDKFFNFTQPGLAIGAGLGYKLSDNISFRAGFTSAKVSADDKNNSKVAFRNLNFKSPITEFHVALEYYLVNIDETRFSPYFFGGLAVFHFNPYTYDTTGKKYFLQPLSTEGEGFFQNRQPYKLTQFALPFGAGVKWGLTDNIHIAVEVGLRKLFTDYLDDVSTTYVDPNLLLTNRGPKALELAFRGGELNTGETYPSGNLKRGEPKNKDWYYFTGVTLSYTFAPRGEIDDRWSKSGKAKKFKTGCPRF